MTLSLDPSVQALKRDGAQVVDQTPSANGEPPLKAKPTRKLADRALPVDYVLPDYVLNELKCRRDPVSLDEALREWLAVKAQIDADFPNAGRRRRRALLEGFRKLRIARGVKAPINDDDFLPADWRSNVYMGIWRELIFAKGWPPKRNWHLR